MTGKIKKIYPEASKNLYSNLPGFSDIDYVSVGSATACLAEAFRRRRVPTEVRNPDGG